jgi:hypothetical protein
MTLVYNTDPAKVDIFAVEGDTLDMTFYVSSEVLATGKKFYAQIGSTPDDGTSYTLGALQIQVRRKDSLKIKEWISDVSPADIVVTANRFHLFDADGFLESGVFDYQVEEFDGVSGFKCIMQGEFIVKKEITI